MLYLLAYQDVVPVPDPLTLLTEALNNPEKVTFGLISLLLIVLLFKLTGKDKVNPELIKLANEANQRATKEHDRVDKEIQALERVAHVSDATIEALQTFQAQLASTMAGMPDAVSRPILAVMREEFPGIARTELSRIQELINRNPVRIGVMSVSGTGRIMAVNEDALTMFGWDAEDILGRFIFSTDFNVIGHDQQRVTPLQYATSQALARKTRINNRLVGIYNKNEQEWVWVVVSAEPSIDPESNTVTRVLTSFIEAGRVIPFDPEAEYAKSLADTAEVAALTQEEIEAANG